ncbi:MAG: FtsX-like permease family protein [Acidobacteriota bacterium]
MHIAYRNLFRNRRRSLITASVIVFGAVALIVSGGFCESMFVGLREETIRTGLGHLQVYQAQFLEKDEDKPLQYGLDDCVRVAAAIEKTPYVRKTTAQIDFMGLLSNGDKSVVFLGTGVQPDREQAMGFSLDITSGSDISTGVGEDAEAVLAIGLAKSLNAKAGDSLTLLTTTTSGALNGLDVKVVGIFSTHIAEYDSKALRINLQSAQILLDTTKVSKLVVGLDRTEHTDAVSAQLASLFAEHRWPLATRRWVDLATFYRQVVTLFRAIFIFLGIIIFVLVVLSSSNTMMMAVMERVREIGTLLAFGTARRQVVTIFVLEGLLMGLLAGLLGLGAGYLSILGINAAEIYMPAPPGSTDGFAIVITKVPALFAGTLALMMVTLTMSSIVPALRASRLKIVDALGHS